jgi:hypothetical protein
VFLTSIGELYLIAYLKQKKNGVNLAAGQERPIACISPHS